ncbi:MAG: DCC1-like thiol-disulfide oxidoreductase family protein, partial [Deltaproteobacteria bacterium]|nr:DCC1-like thiol-disulfide oxidoreductase family protein [Deltaproteobacteria bacterium]
LCLELLYAPLALFHRVRPWIWLLTVMLHLGLLTLIDFADLSLGMLFFHAFTFDPAWIAPKASNDKGTIFYDGHCGLCHGFVRFVLAEDRHGEDLVFSPLQGERFAAGVPESQGADLPDSVVVQTSDGRLLVRSAAVLEIAGRLGGLWRAIGIVVGSLPRRFLDACYDFVARIRRQIFGTTAAVCPLLPPDLQARFLP